MLVRHEISDAVEVFALSGPVGDGDVDALRKTLLRAVGLDPRGIVVDLTAAGPVAPAAVQVLADVRREAPGWPRPALVVCGASPEVAAQLGLPTHQHRVDALAHVDDRSSAPRRRFGLEHALDSPWAARAAARRAAGDLSLEPLADDLQLVVTELVTNAIRYADPPVELEIEAGDDTVTVAVVDGTPGRPAPTHVDSEAEGGRGLHLIGLIAAQTGVRPQPPGKTVWVSLPRGVLPT